MKKLKSLLLILFLFIGVVVLAGCEKQDNNNEIINNENLLKNNREEAEKEIKIAMDDLINEVYAGKIEESRIYIEKVYSSKDEIDDEVVKDMKIGDDEVLFYVNYELKPAKGVNPNELIIVDGRLDEDTGWVVEFGRFGILTPNSDGTSKYKIKNFGTGL